MNIKELALYWNRAARNSEITLTDEAKQWLSQQYIETFSKQFEETREEPEVSEFAIRASSAGKPLVLLALSKLIHLGQYPAGDNLKTFSNRVVFHLGDIMEMCVIAVAALKGVNFHSHQYETRLDMNGYTIVGHIDGIIGKQLLDVKSMSYTYFNEFTKRPNNDRGYLTQIAIYFASLYPQWVDEAYILCVNKSLGTMVPVRISTDTIFGQLQELSVKLETLKKINSLDELRAFAPPPDPVKTKTGYVIPESMKYSEFRYWLYNSDDGVNVEIDNYRKLWYNS